MRRKGMKITCTRGTGMQLEDAVRNALGGVQSATNDTIGMDTIESASRFRNSELDSTCEKILEAVGSQAGLSSAYSVNLGDGTFAWLYFNDNSDEVELISSDGSVLGETSQLALEYVLNTWGKDDNLTWRDGQLVDTSEVYSATNTSNMAGQPVMAGDESQIPSWLLEYYDVITDQEVANMSGLSLEEVEAEKAYNSEYYDADHIAWMEAKADYAHLLDSYVTIEVVAEGGDVFPATLVGDRLSDSTWEIQNYLGIADDEDDIYASTEYEDVYIDVNGIMGERGDEWTISELRDYWDTEQANDPVMSEYPSFDSWLDETLSQMELDED